VSITNASIEIANDVGNRIPVSLDPSQTFGTTAPIMTYTSSVQVPTLAQGGGQAVLLAPGANLNGAIIEQVISTTVNGGTISLLAKTSAPTGIADAAATVLSFAVVGTYTVRQKVPAGAGIYLRNETANPGTYSALLTIL
jgi:hypothetical protein